MQLLKSIFLIALLGGSGLLAAEIYSWQDEDGKTHYGDKVPETHQGAVENVEVGETNSLPLGTTNQLNQHIYRPATEAPNKSAVVTKTGSRSDKFANKRKACKAKHDAYRASSDCFEMCRTVRGTLNGTCVAQKSCKNVVRPDCTEPEE